MHESHNKNSMKHLFLLVSFLCLMANNSGLEAKEISKDLDNEKTFKILFFDFKKTFYKDRRNILENNNCPNCNSEMSLVISEKTPCPKCGASLKEEF